MRDSVHPRSVQLHHAVLIHAVVRRLCNGRNLVVVFLHEFLGHLSEVTVVSKGSVAATPQTTDTHLHCFRLVRIVPPARPHERCMLQSGCMHAHAQGCRANRSARCQRGHETRRARTLFVHLLVELHLISRLPPVQPDDLPRLVRQIKACAPARAPARPPARCRRASRARERRPARGRTRPAARRPRAAHRRHRAHRRYWAYDLLTAKIKRWDVCVSCSAERMSRRGGDVRGDGCATDPTDEWTATISERGTQTSRARICTYRSRRCPFRHCIARRESWAL